MSSTPSRLGDFSGLAENYSLYRPGYSPTVLSALLGMMNRPASTLTAADIGAGTGIWSRMLHQRGLTVTAVEPNDDMRRCGARDNPDLDWRSGSGEATGLPDASVDLVSMASSFHWVDTARALAEFRRILRPEGRFVALWNPRLIEGSPLLEDIEAELSRLAPDMQRVSSGRSGIAGRMTEILLASGEFEDVVALEGRHSEWRTPEQYLGAWRSVNDVQVKLGPDRFTRFLDYIAERLSGLDRIETPYLTRAWSARRIA